MEDELGDETLLGRGSYDSTADSVKAITRRMPGYASRPNGPELYVAVRLMTLSPILKTLTRTKQQGVERELPRPGK